MPGKFITVASGASAEEAFQVALEEADWQNLTSTIAGKDHFKMMPKLPGQDPMGRVHQILQNFQEHSVNTECLCVQVSETQYIFFGISIS